MNWVVQIGLEQFIRHMRWKLPKKPASQGYKKVVAMGGDGTIHEVINGLMAVPEDKRPALGIVPIGSGNDFAYSMNITKRS